MTKQPTDKLTIEFKKNLKAILTERKGKTNPKRLSIDAGLGETAVRDILQNRSASPKLDTISKIAAALNVPIYRLIPSMIDQSYAQISTMEEEIKMLRTISDTVYNNIDELRALAKSHPNK